MPEAQSSSTIAQVDYALPLVIAATGHRNLLKGEILEIRVRVREFLTGLSAQFPDRRLSVMSALAEGG